MAGRFLMFGQTPGTSRYIQANRVWTLGLAMLPLALINLAGPARQRPGLVGGLGLLLSALGSSAMAAGNFVEFYVGEDFGWIFFGAGLSLFTIGCALLGWFLRARGARPELSTYYILQLLGVFALLGSTAGAIGLASSILFASSMFWLGFRPAVVETI